MYTSMHQISINIHHNVTIIIIRAYPHSIEVYIIMSIIISHIHIHTHEEPDSSTDESSELVTSPPSIENRIR